MRLSAIVAMSQNRVIGYHNQLPWHLPADLKHFKKITAHHPIIMGRKTHESIGRVLPGRENIIVTRDASYHVANCTIVHSIDAALVNRHNEELFIIGGAELFRQTLARVDRLYLTIIHQDFEGDVFFPEIAMQEWKEIAKEDHAPDQENKFRYSFIILDSLNKK